MKESVETGNRKLIRPSLSEVKEQFNQHKKQPPPSPRQKRSIPPDQTHAESFYYLKQMQNRTPMVLVLQDGEELRGAIEWYDKTCLKLHRENGPNVLVYKESVKYLYKESEKAGSAEAEPPSRRSGKSNGSPST